MKELVIEATGLRCAYGSFEAVRGVDLHVRQGDVYALLGTNGAGKTTALETLEGHRAPSAGHLRVLGLDPVTERKQLRPRVGIMLQHSGFAGDLTVSETVELWRAMSTCRQPLNVLSLLNLEHREKVQVKQLSGGERRRLDLALAVMSKPELLFLDEPTTGLDPESRRRTWQVVRWLHEEGTTVLLTTHYLEEAEQLSHRLAIMHEGRIRVEGTLADVLATEPARISFTLPPDLPAAELPRLPATRECRVREGTDLVELSSGDLQGDLTALLSWSNTRGTRLARLRASHASLEDVFHGVLGRTPAESVEVTA
ncbi:multidrug ABC transporter ATP-binding protein [Longimycelium tulufanense]|uniref:Multidrug ABC transporter ATP-binding protein n=1 Tax=Longimycelium tulufanense TaxID=907463 RepID=A0A8J3FWT9_9PSEU|nr:ABC transporter ATP-binding protein [Longimycelium tulufanense]GGM69258.1 multidrug ABC transporter ATP-binding protein [Longimycelium tulufanense]